MPPYSLGAGRLPRRLDGNLVARRLRGRNASPHTSSRSRDGILYPPNTAGQYDLRLRSQLMLPPLGTVFLLIPAAPLTPDGPDRMRTIPLHRLVTSLPLLSHAYIGFVSLPEAIFHANHTVRYPTSVRAIQVDSQSVRFCDLSTVDSCSLQDIDSHSSACRHAVSLGLVVYYPYGRLGTLPFLSPPGELSTEDIQVPTPGWLSPGPPSAGIPGKRRPCTSS